MTHTELKEKLTDCQYSMEQLNEKLNKRKVYKGRDGWQAKTEVKDVKGYDWEISTFKTGRGTLVTTAQAGKYKDQQGYSSFTYLIFGDPRVNLMEVRERCTENTINNLHTKGLQQFVNKLELSNFKPTHN